MSPRRYQDWASFKFPAGPGDPADGADGADGAAEAPVAFCADLSPASVLGAYKRGIVPLPAADEFFRGLNEIRFEEQVAAGTIALVGDKRDDPYLVAWWSPDPRLTIPADGVHLGRNVRKRLRRDGLTTTANADFRRVAEACRAGREPRWLTDTLVGSLTELHEAGWAHSIEVWRNGELAGGALAVGLGGLMSGDSLFSWHQGAAAVAVADLGARLAAVGGTFIDAQWDSPFLRSLGAAPVARDRFLDLLDGPLEPVPLPAGPLPARRLLPGCGLPRPGYSRWWPPRVGGRSSPRRSDQTISKSLVRVVPGEQVRGLPRRVSPGAGYMRSGSGTPSRPRPVVSTRSVAAHSARRDCLVSSSLALSTGHSS